MDTIAAIATGASPTAIGVIRVSGPETDEIVGRVFHPRRAAPFSALEPRRMFLGTMSDRSGQVLDSGMAVRFPGPASYTGEDSAELHCHGSPAAMGEILAALFAAGARQAQPGEFTRRAFLNGKLDLTQAEAVIDLIDAETAAAAQNAAAQLGGALGRAISPVYDALTAVSSQFYAVVDYPDEDIEDLDRGRLEQTLRRADTSLTRLLDTCGRGRVLKRGVSAAIVGLPNAGKSSLLNALAGYDRAIVTNVPGTTRDTVEESILCGGVLLRLTDTAGLRETEDTVEQLGVERSRAAAQKAELVLAVLDSSAPQSAETEEVFALAAQCPQWVLIWSKADLAAAPPQARLDPQLPGPAAVVSVSSVTGQGLDALGSIVAGLFPPGGAPAGEVLTNTRQSEAVSRARDAVRRALAALDAGMTPDMILADAEEAMNVLGELTGRTAREDIVSDIFSRFCVGK